MELGALDLVAYLVYLAFFVFGLATAPRDALSLTALSLSSVCAVLWFVARWQLGDAFSVGAKARRLVTTGLYSKIRHPIYLFGTLAFLFVVLALLGWYGLVVWAIVTAIQVRRSLREERLLLETFGQEYVTYRDQTWF